MGWAADLPQGDFHATNNRQAGDGAARNPPPLVETIELRRGTRKSGTARRGNATRARGRPQLWTCAPSNQKIHDMSILNYVNILQYVWTSPGTSKQVFGWCRPLRPSPWPRHALIQPASPFGKSTRGGNKVCACVEIRHPQQQADRKTTRPRKQCHLICAGPLHGKVHCEAKKQKNCLKLGG